MCAKDKLAPTVREVQVLCLVAKGHSNKYIAQELKISLRTVEAHLSRAYEKLGSYGRIDAVLKARQKGWISLD